MFLLFVSSSSLLATGCGGTAENSVAAPPAVVQTQEELDATAKAYADSAAEMRKRDQQSN